MENNINHIIARTLSGEASSEDILSLSEWLNDSERNRDEFRQMKSYWDAEVTFCHSVAPSLQANKLLREVEQRCKNQKRQQQWRLFAPLAATVALVLALSALSFMHYRYYQASEYYTLLTDEHKSSFTMDDGTQITLNKNSRLTYTNAYGKKERSVKLEGEAFFEVSKDATKPFVVAAGEASIIVLGTHFNVKADTSSDDITATLVEGSIRFEGSKQNIVMTPNQQLTFSCSTNKIDLKQVDTDTFTGWKNGLLKYKSIPFINLIIELEKTYQVEIKIENKQLTKPDVTVSGTFSSEQNIEQILKVITRSLPIKWSNSNGTYYIR